MALPGETYLMFNPNDLLGKKGPLKHKLKEYLKKRLVKKVSGRLRWTDPKDKSKLLPDYDGFDIRFFKEIPNIMKKGKNGEF